MNDFESELLEIAEKGLVALEALSAYAVAAIGMLDVPASRDMAIAVGQLKIREKTYVDRIAKWAAGGLDAT
jgi:hypothetical protein